jgi:hypothetical protein
MKLPLLLHNYQYAAELDPPTLAPVEVYGEQLERYMEWYTLFNQRVVDTITEEQFICIPQEGHDGPDGVYLFSFPGGKIYVEIENRLARQLSGYATSELSLFDAITREYGEALQKEISEAQEQTTTQAVQREVNPEGTLGEQSTEVLERTSEVQGEDKSNSPMDIQPD